MASCIVLSMKNLIPSLRSYFEGDSSKEYLPTVEEMDALLPPEWCDIQLVLARNHKDPEPLLAELRPKKVALEQRIMLVEQKEAQTQAEIEDLQQVNGGRMTLREKLLVAGFIVTLPISLSISLAVGFDQLSKGSKWMRCNLSFLTKMEAELERSSKRKTAIADIDAALDA